MNETKDEGLQGNEKIEQAVLALQHEPTQEQLAHTLTVLRRRMKAQGQLVAAAEPNLGGAPLQLRTVQSTFLVEIEKLFDAALTVPEISGVILNPWDRTLQLDKNLIRIIKG